MKAKLDAVSNGKGKITTMQIDFSGIAKELDKFIRATEKKHKRRLSNEEIRIRTIGS